MSVNPCLTKTSGLVVFAAVVAAAVSSACAPLQKLSSINVKALLDQNKYKYWETAQTIDAGDYEVNNDTSRGCLDTGGGDVGLLDGAFVTRGCMQPPPIVYTDGAWFVGFYQNYLFTTASSKFSAFVNSTLYSSAFGTLGLGLNIIDSGLGIAPTAVAPMASARNMRFAKLSNGNIAAVFMVHDPDDLGLTTSDDRVVFASIYDASTDTWGAATQLGTADATTDVAEDYDAGNWNTPFCAPAIAAGPNGDAIAMWCETVGTEARIFYAEYSAGAWSAATQLISAASAVAFPGFSGYYHTFSGTVNTTTIYDHTAGDNESFTISFDGTTEGGIACASDCTATVTMTAVSTVPSTTSEFQIHKKADGTVLLCDTMTEALNRALFATPVAGTRTLHERGVGVWIDPACDDTDNTTWNFAVRFNKSLAAEYRTIGTATDNAVAAVTDTFNNLTIDPGTLQTNVVPYSRNALVDIAADDYGNYLAVRSVVAPYFDDNAGSTVGSARQLVGHVYLNGTGWYDRSGGTDPEAYLISRNPSCYSGNTSTSGTTYFACSVRRPKALMSSTGHGLILYYQNQRDPVSSTVAASSDSFPNRLWYSTYSVATGFSGTSATVDGDVICNSSSLRNDSSVCEGGSSAIACQLEREPGTLPLSSTWVDTNLPPIAAAMNDDGQAIVAYHKYYYLSDGTCGSYIGTHAVFYDPTNGLGSVTQLDDETGDTMHANVAINDEGDAAVVWEQIISGVRYVFLRTYIDGSWSSRVTINEGYTGTDDAAMPAVSILDDGEILVSFTANTGTGTTRRQYTKRYRPLGI